MDKVQEVLDRSLTHINRAPIVAEKNLRAVRRTVSFLNRAMSVATDPALINALLETSISLEGAFEESVENQRDLVQDIGALTTAYRDAYQEIVDKVEALQKSK